MKFKFEKKLLALAFACSCSFIHAESAHAWGFEGGAAKTAALGIVLGIPNAVTGKYWLNSDQAVDGGLGFSYGNFINVYGDYLFHFRGILGSSNQFFADLQPYVGLGAEVFISEDTQNPDGHYYSSGNNSSEGFGIRVPLGVEWNPSSQPLGVFAEVVPGLGIIPNTFGFLHAGVGIRFYF